MMKNQRNSLVLIGKKVLAIAYWWETTILFKFNMEITEYPWTKKLTQTLNEVFKIENFRAKQLPAINASMKGHDVLLIMPTGAGKSLCYQLPALISEGGHEKKRLSETSL